jgi:predicted ATPase
MQRNVMDRDLPATEAEAGGAWDDMSGGLASELAAAGFADGQEIGRGGFGVVYRCRQVALERVVAVKVLTVQLDADRARFAREQHAMARLTSHPNIVPVLQIGETESGQPFLVMPYCGQGNIHERIHRLGALEVAEVLRLGVKMAAALACAHQADIVHRDVKPANILYTDYGEPALGDFGIARTGSGGFETATGVFVGSPAFAAPEVLSGQPPSTASDVYGLGASLFTAMTGHVAFERRAGEKMMAQFVRITTEPVPDLRGRGIPEAAAAIVDTAMARDPADRVSALELGELIQRAQAQLGLPVTEMVLHSGHGTDRRRAGSLASMPVTGGGGGRLPATVASFVGREAESALLQELLSTSRLVTLVGMGGVGKTTLACHTAARLRPQFGDGAWWVELAELRQGGLLTELVAAELGVRDQMGRALADVLADFLAPRHTLLVLDNCEHLIDDTAKLAEALLRDCPQLQILATSREVLDIEGEAVLRLSPLSCPAVGDAPTMRTLGGYEAVQLFVQRARAAVPGFSLDDRNAAAIARCCARLDGLPLAIELAAARLRAMSADQIAEELSDRFALLSHARRGAVTRRQSLAACVEWSYELCTHAEQQLWCRLSVLAEGFDLPTARGICSSDTPDIPAHVFLDVLCALVDKSILIRTEDNGAVSFRLLETLRDYGKSRTTETEHTQLARRHAGWYHQLLTDAESHWFGPQQVQWIQRLTREMPNIREAMEFSLTDCPPAAADMIADLRRYWVYHASLSEGCQWANRALAALSPEPSVERIRALFAAAHLHLRHGDAATAISQMTEARALLEVVDDPVTRGRLDFFDGYTALLTGNLDQARDNLQRGMDITDDFEVHAFALSAMGWLDLISGDARSALAWSEKGVELARARGDWAMRAVLMGSLGASHWHLGDAAHAEQVLRDGLKLAFEVNDKYAVANGLEVLAWICQAWHPRQAAVLMAAAAKISAASGATLATFVLGEFHAKCERQVREQLGADEFQKAWEEGTALSMAGVAAALSLDLLTPGPGLTS